MHVCVFVYVCLCVSVCVCVCVCVGVCVCACVRVIVDQSYREGSKSEAYSPKPVQGNSDEYENGQHCKRTNHSQAVLLYVNDKSFSTCSTQTMWL